MDVLLRELRDGPGGFTTSRDTELATRELSIGCAPDQQIQLLGRAVGARHAVIRDARPPSLVCLGRFRAIVNGDEVRSARLDIGDCIEIGGHQLTLTEPPSGFDLAIELRPNAKIDSSDFEAAFRTDLQQTWLGKRWTAWLMMVLVVSVGFVLPYLAVRGRGPAPPTAVTALLPVQQSASALWSTGPLAPGHRQLSGQRCGDCHQSLFTQVQDGACQACHGKVGAHVERTRLAATSLGPAQRCADCHREHEEPTGFLVDRSDRVCVGCHADAPRTFGALKIAAVTGFGAGRHPSFVALARRQNAAPDRSGLKFSHVQHLDGGRVRRKDSTPLGCADCHKLSATGLHFEPTTMAGNCVSCHELTFDPDAPDRQLPHGKPREVVRVIEDYFVRKLSDPNRTRGGANGEARRRLPGHEEPQQAASPACTGSPYRCAMQMAAEEVATEFERRGCVTCHRVTDTRNKDLTERFQVVPIRLVHDSYPAARFPHDKHLVQGAVTGDDACTSCHTVDGSATLDFRLPDLPACEGCHTDKPSRDRTRLQCVSCHSYHPHS